MTTTNTLQRNGRPVRRDAAPHLFTVGQAVRLKRGYRGSALPADIYHITGTLPPSGGSPQYRIRNDDARHERVTTQDGLEPVRISSADEGATLIAKTFGNQIKPGANGSASLDRARTDGYDLLPNGR
ncbi:hypothetical protein [Sinorhizobium sp. BJ1]|uniref:hypothetical protein n=1 Tax=Sinorhizobium sp. BJ1 TaxID=2035455 RepID=UPI000BE893AB|nr:hypothetical protein [Sinorhizobium sp. BJ1]PDT78054.1 hypothetical protein CO676_32645 [Sinorhizobium sp. BJ1]